MKIENPRLLFSKSKNIIFFVITRFTENNFRKFVIQDSYDKNILLNEICMIRFFGQNRQIASFSANASKWETLFASFRFCLII